LVLALGAEVASEALAETSRVVADTAARAVTALLVTVAKEHVRSRWAFLKGAVRATVAQVTNAANMLHGVPRSSVGLGGFSCELLLGVADTTAGAVVRAHSALASDAVVVVEAFALAGLAVADTLVRAFNLRVSLVRSSCHCDPCSCLWASTEGAVVLSPSRIAVRTSVADAFVVAGASTVAGAAVWAVGRSHHSAHQSKGEDKNGTGHCCGERSLGVGRR